MNPLIAPCHRCGEDFQPSEPIHYDHNGHNSHHRCMTTPPTIQFNEINEGERARKDYGDIKLLCESILAVGTIHPIALSRRTSDGRFDLVAGGRRYRALGSLGTTVLHHGSTLTPGRPGFVFADEVPDDLRKEAELHENLYRLQMRWVEEVLLVDETHWAKKRANRGNWGVRETAAILGNQTTHIATSYALRLAKLIKAGDKKIIECKNMSEAIEVLLGRNEDKALAELQMRASKIVAPSNTTPTDLSSFLDTLNNDMQGSEQTPAPTAAVSVLGLLPPTATPIKAPQPSIAATIAAMVPLSLFFKRGDSVTGPTPILDSFPAAHFNHIVTDIPYGIDMDNFDKKMVEDVRAEHDVADNMALFEPFLTKAFRVVRPHGFCVFFYDLDHHEKLQKIALKVGWKVQAWPLVWVKTHTCRNGAPQYNFTKNFEVAMVLRRDSEAVLRSPQTSCWFQASNVAERQTYNNPFAKPFELWKWIYSAIAFPSQTVMDPYAGEMSACAAAVNCGLVPYGIEINEKHYNRGMERMRLTYTAMHGLTTKFE